MMTKVFSRRHKQLPHFAALCLAIAMCAPLHAASRVDHDQVIQGQVFIVTKGQQAIRLALVSVTAVPADDVKRFLNLRRQKFAASSVSLAAQAEMTRAGAKTKLAIVEQELAKANEEQADLRASIDLKKAPCTQIDLTAEFSKFSKCIRDLGIAPLVDKQGEQTQRIAMLSVQSEDLRTIAQQPSRQIHDSPEGIFSGLINAPGQVIASAKTDVDGKFTMRIPSTGDLVLVAQSSHAVGGSDEQYRWLIWLRRSPGANISEVTLANDNLLASQCEECVLP